MNTIIIVCLIMWGVVGILFCIFVFDYIIRFFKSGKIKTFFEKRKENKLKRKLSKDTSKQQIKKHNKKKDSINFEALKFEYNEIYSILNDAVKEIIGTTENMSEVYLLKFDEYFKRKKSYGSEKIIGVYSLETFACLVKALIKEPVFKKLEGLNVDIVNLQILDKVTNTFSHKNVTYNDTTLKAFEKDLLVQAMQQNYQLYEDDIFLIALYLVEKYY